MYEYVHLIIAYSFHVIKLKHCEVLKEANGIWRIKTNKEMDELIKQQKITNYVKAQ